MAELGFGIPLRHVVPPCASPLCSVTPYVVPLRRGRVLPAPCTAPSLLPARPREMVWMYVNGSKKDDAADEVPVAFMVRAADSDIAKEAIKEYISKQVVFYKRLHKVYFTHAIPKSASGKILRKELRAKLAAAANA